MPWYRHPMAVAAAVLAVVAGAGGATALALRADTSAAPVLPAPSVGKDGSATRTVVAVPDPAFPPTSG